MAADSCAYVVIVGFIHIVTMGMRLVKLASITTTMCTAAHIVLLSIRQPIFREWRKPNSS